MVPLATFTHYEFDHTPVSVNHKGLFVATTISFNLAPGYSLSDAVAAIQATIAQIHMPVTIHGSFAGTADRKSTRLNSSHQIISYAVFCLKKKKKNNIKYT